jgi:hypothetical protein
MPYRATDTDHLRAPVTANSGHATSRAELGVHLHLGLLMLLARLPGVPAIYNSVTIVYNTINTIWWCKTVYTTVYTHQS